MISDDNFVLTVTKGSVLHRAGGYIVLDKIPENAFQLWKDGESVLSLRKTGAPLLENISKTELVSILEKRKNLDYQVEIKLLQDAIKALDKKPTNK